ncbi:hypothetical protein CKAH01_04708 [Colletotrichum kahawae]|uniref:Uncharacterized protein n=1 Tax=Colletotrichum kahawae TaxID=34407 RepID=A0AAE0D6S4_COLKA|nr:hypothetical protein CKAH01_04708 [Colletotrichum kahawae]
MHLLPPRQTAADKASGIICRRWAAEAFIGGHSQTVAAKVLQMGFKSVFPPARAGRRYGISSRTLHASNPILPQPARDSRAAQKGKAHSQSSRHDTQVSELDADWAVGAPVENACFKLHGTALEPGGRHPQRTAPHGNWREARNGSIEY